MTRSGRPYHHGELRRDLLGAARQLLDEGGPAALTLRETARRVGVAAPSAYHHFPNLDALAAAVAAEGFAELAATLEAAPTDAEGRLGPAGEAYINWARANPRLYRLMFGEKFRQAVEASNAVRDGRARTHELLVGGLAKRLPDADLLLPSVWMAGSADAWALPKGPSLPPTLALPLYQWVAFIAAFGFGSRWLPHTDGPVRRTLTEAVFPLYIVHQTALIICVHFLRAWELPAALEAAIILGATAAACWATYLIARRVTWLRPLFGLRLRATPEIAHAR